MEKKKKDMFMGRVCKGPRLGNLGDEFPGRKTIGQLAKIPFGRWVSKMAVFSFPVQSQHNNGNNIRKSIIKFMSIHLFYAAGNFAMGTVNL